MAYTTNDGTATAANNDYVDNDGSLTFAGTSGETKTITVLVNGDTTVEPNETFTVALGAISGLAAGVPGAPAPSPPLAARRQAQLSTTTLPPSRSQRPPTAMKPAQPAGSSHLPRPNPVRLTPC